MTERSLFTVGHSTHPIDEFLALLDRHGIRVLADVRRFPGSRRQPHFHREQLASALSAAGIGYRWFQSLGGRRPKSQNETSRNLGLRNESFRNYADYMLTPEFRHGVDELLEVAGQKRTAIMCSEGLFWRCHRRLISDYLSMKGITVQHIMPNGQLQPHTLTSGTKIADGEVTYPMRDADQTGLLFE